VSVGGDGAGGSGRAPRNQSRDPQAKACGWRSRCEASLVPRPRLRRLPHPSRSTTTRLFLAFTAQNVPYPRAPPPPTRRCAGANQSRTRRPSLASRSRLEHRTPPRVAGVRSRAAARKAAPSLPGPSRGGQHRRAPGGGESGGSSALPPARARPVERHEDDPALRARRLGLSFVLGRRPAGGDRQPHGNRTRRAPRCASEARRVVRRHMVRRRPAPRRRRRLPRMIRRRAPRPGESPPTRTQGLKRLRA
jgi:hypothetical protein